MVARKSATKTQARERARAAMQERVAREQRIQEQAELFFQKTLGRENEKEALREKIEQLQQQLKELDAPAPEGAEHVAALKAEGLKNSEIADMLGLKPSTVSLYAKGEGGSLSASPTQGEESRASGTEDGSSD